LEVQVDPFIRLDANGKAIALKFAPWWQWKHEMGGAVKLNQDFTGSGSHPFAGTEIKGNAAPSPVVNV
jgi:hypothetical protein